MELASESAPGTFLLCPRFFEGFPDWEFARVPALRNERVFAWQLTLPGYAQPSAEQRQSLLRWLPRTLDARSMRSSLEAARIHEIQVVEGRVSTSLRGLVLDGQRLRRTLEALGELVARRSA